MKKNTLKIFFVSLLLAISLSSCAISHKESPTEFTSFQEISYIAPKGFEEDRSESSVDYSNNKKYVTLTRYDYADEESGEKMTIGIIYGIYQETCPGGLPIVEYHFYFTINGTKYGVHSNSKGLLQEFIENIKIENS